MATPSSSLHELADELDAIYRLAQGLTDNASQATDLTRHTFRRARKQLAQNYQPDDRSLWLRHLLIETYSSNLASTSPEHPDIDERDDFRHKALRQLLRSAMPAAFASLSVTKRSLLLLCKVESLSCADAGEILGIHVDTASAKLSDAFSELRIKIYQIASPPESQLLDQYLTDELLKQALLHFASASLRTAPASLREHIHSELEANQVEAEPTTSDPDEDSTSSRASPSHWVRRLSVAVTILLIIALAGFIGYMATNQLASSAETNLLTLSANESRSVQMEHLVTNAEQAAVIIQDELGLRLTPPLIEGTSVRGVDIAEIAPNVRVPVLLYRDHSSERTIPVYAYTYGQLNRYEDRIHLTDTVLRSLDDERHVVAQDAGNNHTALIWRQRDKIFVAIPPGNVSDLRSRIQP